jgi:hypothetical protein
LSESTCAFVGRRWKEIRVSVGLSDARISGGEDVEFRGLEELLAMTETRWKVKVGVAREGPHNGLHDRLEVIGCSNQMWEMPRGEGDEGARLLVASTTCSCNIASWSLDLRKRGRSRGKRA